MGEHGCTDKTKWRKAEVQRGRRGEGGGEPRRRTRVQSLGNKKKKQARTKREARRRAALVGTSGVEGVCVCVRV